MTLPTDSRPAEWSGQRLISLASHHLQGEFERRYPEAAEMAAEDPIQAIRLVPDVLVRWATTPPKGACDLGGVYEGDSEPANITIRESPNFKRNYFTSLHELGHHLFYNDATWQYEILPKLGRKGRLIEEKIVNSFAANILVPEATAAHYLGREVTPRGILSLIEGTQASATTCCIRALDRPGERLIILSSVAGGIYYADSNGTPYNPGKKVHQPALVKAIDRARNSGQYTLGGGEGIRYARGWADTDIRLDVLVHDELAIAVVTSTRPQMDSRADSGWYEVCEACGAEFRASESTGLCSKCGDWNCPDCRGCQCSVNQTVFCERCFLALSVEEASRGLKVHEDC